MSRHARVNPSAPPRYRRWDSAVTVLSALSGTVFTLMRLAHVTSWPWAWVTSPLWIGGLVILLGGMVTAAFKSPSP